MGAGINCLFSLRSPSIAVTTVVSFSLSLGGLLERGNWFVEFDSKLGFP